MYGFSNAAKENIDNNKITRAYLKVLATSTKPEIIINEKNYLKDIEFSDERYVPNEGFIGQAVAKEVKGNFNNIVQDFSIQDREFELYFGVELQDRTTEYKKYGTFIVQRPPQDNQVNDNTKFTALDYMVKLNKVWENRLTYPTTIRNIFNDLGSQVGMSVMTATFPNESFIVDSNQFEDGTTCRQVLKAIAQVAFSWARIDENNVIQLDFSKSLPIAKELTTDNYFTLSKQDEFTPINKVTFAMSQVEGESKSIQDNTSISQNGLNEFVIYDNPFAYTEAKRTLLVANGNVLFGLRYTPIKLNTTGLIYLNCKDRIGVTNADGERFETFVLNHKIKYNGICLDSIESDAKTQAQTKYEFKSEISKKITHTELIVDKAKAEINARVDSVETKVNTATTTANKAAEDLGKLEIKVNDDIKDLQDQIDGNITTWFYEVAPTLTNAPAKDWTTTELKNMHLGDIYYDTKTGYAYRFMLKDGVYSWQKLSDSDIEKALQVAQNAQDTADNKRRVFYNTPVPPYDKGDLWVQGSDGDILRCNTAKTDKQTYAQSDWVKASKYTDDTVANSVKNSAIGTVDVQYALSDSQTTAPTSGWQTTAPEWTEGKYMWQKTVTTYINGTVQESKATCIAGAKGKDGTNGTNGKDGTSITIKSTSVTYQASTSGTTTPTGTWSTTVPTVNKGEYLWTKTVVTYSDNKTTTAYSVAYKGTDGSNGKDGTNGTNGKNSYTHIRYSASADGTNFDTNPNGKGYIGIYYGELATAPTDKTKYTWSKYVGKDGTNGTNGKDGKDGNGITSITYFYATTTTQTAPSAQSITSTTIPSLTPTNKYLWQKEVIDFSDSTVADKTTVSLLGVYGDNGATGTGIESITEEYYLSTSKTTQTGGSWVTTPPTWEYGKYIWTRSKIVYKNPSSTSYTTPVCSSEWEAVDELSKITKTANGESVLKLEECGDYEFDKFEMYGNTKQQTYQGYNLYNMQIVSQVSGVSASVDKDGYLVLNGVPTKQWDKPSVMIDIYNVIESNQKYTMWQEKAYTSNESSAYLQITLRDKDGKITNLASMSGKYLEIQIDKSVYTSASIYVQWGTNLTGFNNYKNRFMLYKGSYDANKQFEPYVGGTASPNPSYPQELKNVSGWNLWNNTKLNLINNNLTSLNINQDVIEMKGKTNWNNISVILENTFLNIPMSISMKFIEKSISSKKGFTIWGNNTNSFTGATQLNNNVKQIEINTEETLTASFNTGNYKYICIRIWNNYSDTVLSKDTDTTITEIQLNNQGVRPYQPYGNIGVKVKGKNLLNYTLLTTRTFNGITVTNNNNGTYTLNGTSTAQCIFSLDNLTLDTNKKYKLTGCATGGSSTKYYLAGANFTDYGNGSNYVVPSRSDVTISIVIQSGTSCNNLTFKPMLSEIEEASDFEPYQDQSFSLPLQRELCEINGKRDTFVNLNGAWYERHYVGKVVFDGSENWSKSSTYVGAYYKDSTSYGRKSASIYYSTHFNHVEKTSEYKKGTCYTGDASFDLFIGDSSTYTTVAEFKTWLSQNKPIVYYELAEPEDLKCTEEQTQVLNNIIQAKTYKGTTYVEAESVLSPIFDITYLTDNPLNETYAKMAEIRDIMQNTIQETYISKTSWESDIKIGEESISQYVKKTQNDVTKIQQGLGEYAKTSEVNKTITTAMEDVSTDVSRLLSFQREVETNGVTQVKTSTGFLFNEDGLTIEKTDAKVKSILNEKGLDIQDATGSTNDDLLFAGYDEELGETVVKSKNIKVEKYLTIGLHSRMEDYTDSNGAGTGIFYI